MKYLDGRDVMLGDQVDLGVVCCFDEGLFASGFPWEEWVGPEKGVMVKLEQADLIHFAEPDVDLVLVQRVDTINLSQVGCNHASSIAPLISIHLCRASAVKIASR